MKVHRYFSGAALAASVILTVVGIFKGAAVLIGLAAAIEIAVSAITGKKTNIYGYSSRIATSHCGPISKDSNGKCR